MEAILIFPHQLFWPNPLLRSGRQVWLIEEPLLFHDPNHAPIFHAQKRILHRATLRKYADRLSQSGWAVRYVAYSECMSVKPHEVHAWLFSRMKAEGVRRVYLFEPVDYLLERRLRRAQAKESISLVWEPSPAFLTSREENAAFWATQKRYYQTQYYIWQRKRLKILLEPSGKPVGGRWTFDTENRKRLPSAVRACGLPLVAVDAYVKEATAYVKRLFPNSWGEEGPWWLPTSHEEAEEWLEHFLQQKLFHFGPYQDAFEAEEPFLFHSVLSPMLNIGLLTPRQVLAKTLETVQNAAIPLSSLEGFLRQLIGWREYIRSVYEEKGVALRLSNSWGHAETLPRGWEEASTGFPPVDAVLRRLRRWGYAHHIERLMVLGNFLFLQEVHPDLVYQFFMRAFVDAYDWVMVPNVYGMSQHASALITTKPYFSSSRYLLTMSHFPRGAWCERWDALFWRWVGRHQAGLAAYPRLKGLLRHLRERFPSAASNSDA